MHIHTCNNLCLCTFVSAFYCWNRAVYETTVSHVIRPTRLRSRTHISANTTHTHGCKCVFWLWKSCLYSFVVSGPGINQITAMAAASPHPPPHSSCSSNHPLPSSWLLCPARAQVALEGAPPFSQQAADAALHLDCVSPKRPPMPGDQTRYFWSDIKPNREECKPLNSCSQSHDSPCQKYE